MVVVGRGEVLGRGALFACAGDEAVSVGLFDGAGRGVELEAVV